MSPTLNVNRRTPLLFAPQALLRYSPLRGENKKQREEVVTSFTRCARRVVCRVALSGRHFGSRVPSLSVPIPLPQGEVAPTKEVTEGVCPQHSTRIDVPPSPSLPKPHSGTPP